MAGGMVPAIGMAIATFLARNKSGCLALGIPVDEKKFGMAVSGKAKASL
ncbi:hypothetical protein MASRES_GEN12917_15110 [Acinetobacter baumannii]